MHEGSNRVVPVSAECESGSQIEQFPYLLHMHEGSNGRLLNMIEGSNGRLLNMTEGSQ